MTVQLGGPHLNNKTLFWLKRRLKNLGVMVSYPMTNGLITVHGRRFTFNPQKWSLYEVELSYFESIANNSVHIVCNESGSQAGLINQTTALGILQAILHDKPVVLLHNPTFSKDVDLFLREVINANKNKFFTQNMTTLSDAAIKHLFIQLPKTVDYTINPHQVTLARSRLKTYFRVLLNPHLSYRSLLAVGR